MTVVRDSSAARNHSRKSSVKASSRICDFFWCTSPSVFPHKQTSRNLTPRHADIHHESTDCYRPDCSIPCLAGRTETGRCFVAEEVHLPVCCTTGAVSLSSVIPHGTFPEKRCWKTASSGVVTIVAWKGYRITGKLGLKPTCFTSTHCSAVQGQNCNLAHLYKMMNCCKGF